MACEPSGNTLSSGSTSASKMGSTTAQQAIKPTMTATVQRTSRPRSSERWSMRPMGRSSSSSASSSSGLAGGALSLCTGRFSGSAAGLCTAPTGGTGGRGGWPSASVAGAASAADSVADSGAASIAAADASACGVSGVESCADSCADSCIDSCLDSGPSAAEEFSASVETVVAAAGSTGAARLSFSLRFDVSPAFSGVDGVAATSGLKGLSVLMPCRHYQGLRQPEPHQWGPLAVLPRRLRPGPWFWQGPLPAGCPQGA